MKRHMLGETGDTSPEIPEGLEDYVAELQLLWGVPLSYLIPDPAFLPPESLRFFHVDENWTEALADGALSVGRTTASDREFDRRCLEQILPQARARLHMPRLKKMHENHRASAMRILSARSAAVGRSSDAEPETCGHITGFFLRSELVRMLQGLEISAYDGETELPMLRLERYSDEIAMGLFDGAMTSLVFSEPKTGLTFGLGPGVDMLVPKDVSEENLGRPMMDQQLDLSAYRSAAGRLDMCGLARELGARLHTEIGPAKLAYELIGVAGRAVFTGKNYENGDGET